MEVVGGEPKLTLPTDDSFEVQYDDGSTLSRDTLISQPGVMNYVNGELTKEPYVKRDLSGSDVGGIQGVVWKPQHVHVYNARRGRTGTQEQYTVDREGFELLQSPVPKKEKESKMIDFLDSNDVIDHYYPHCEELLKKALLVYGGDAASSLVVKAFDHNVRMTAGTEEDIKNGNGSKTQNPVGVVHGDYTRVSARRRIIDLATQPPKANDTLRHRLTKDSGGLLNPDLVQEAVGSLTDDDDEEEEESKIEPRRKLRRFAFINVWRNIDTESPVMSSPISCVDATTVHVDDLRTLRVHYADRIGENYLVSEGGDDNKSCRRHRWNYYAEMSIDEALLIKQWDSYGGIANGAKEDFVNNANNKGGEISSFCIHSAFLMKKQPNETTPPPPRKSIEVRCVCIW